ncbi:unnamed protein product [Parnassius apollo]|uniref:(apollo) hypothetical protein n=1 Tax=Parnassius apollo TaxID=110799 RepID=A0A8S3XG07_PARAO|nr:unnamed protein product [Parnassius apollo]
MPPDIFEKKKNDFLLSITVNNDEIEELEKKTKAQFNSDLWIVERKKRITTSLFGQICKMKDSTSCTATLKNMLYSTFTGNDATRYGTAHETTAIADLEIKIKQKVTPCGLFICMDKPYLGASPDDEIDSEPECLSDFQPGDDENISDNEVPQPEISSNARDSLPDSDILSEEEHEDAQPSSGTYHRDKIDLSGPKSKILQVAPESEVTTSYHTCLVL